MSRRFRWSDLDWSRFHVRFRWSIRLAMVVSTYHYGHSPSADDEGSSWRVFPPSSSAFSSGYDTLASVRMYTHNQFYLPNYPETAMWLTDEERAWACERMGPYAPRGTDKHFNKVDFFNTLKSLEFWLFSITYFLLANSGESS